MLRAWVLDFKGSWENYVPRIEFMYNNSYQATIQMVPYEVLYWSVGHLHVGMELVKASS